MPPDPARRAPLRTVTAYLLGIAALAAGITLLFFGQRAVMDIGGFCAEGGPYVIETSCPEGSSAATLLGVFGGLAGFIVALFAAMAIGARALGLLLLAWPALFGVVGFNFLQYGLDPPGEDAGWAWGWLVCGVVFWAMAFGPLVMGLWLGATANGPAGTAGGSGRPRGAAERTLVRAAPGGARLAARSDARLRRAESARAAAGVAPAATFPIATAAFDAPEPARPDLVDGLERLAALHRAGSLTDGEYARAKTELLEDAGA
jgi:hypothetical protein